MITDAWEDGYAIGYERALQHVLMLVEGQVRPSGTFELVRGIVEKLRKEVLHDDDTVRSP